MAIYNKELQNVINNFNNFKTFFIDDKKCIFTGKVVFTKENIEEYRKQIIIGYDGSNRSNIAKYRDQIQKGMKNSDTFNLFFANLYYLYDLVRNIDRKNKVNRICFYLECNRKDFHENHNITDKEIEKILDSIKYDKSKIENIIMSDSIVNSTAYNTNMYIEINFIFGFFEQLLNGNSISYKDIINNLKFDNLINNEVKNAKVIKKFVARNSLLYLLYPEQYEPILSYTNKEKIVTFYKGAIVEDDYEQLDKDLFEIRKSLPWMSLDSGSFYEKRKDNNWKEISISHSSKKRKKNTNTIEDIPSEGLPVGDEREAIIKSRIGQSEFRKKLIEKYQKCCICGIEEKSLLIASHIKPWSECDNGQEKTDYECNGLLLCPQHDRLFDKGYISFEDDGEIIISNSLNKKEYELVNIKKKFKLNIGIRNEMKNYFKYHRDKKFKA